jgi:outer membrane protein assembly factor BamB
MPHKSIGLTTVVALGLVGASMMPARAARDAAAERFWAQWRGPFANGTSRTATPPIEWSETKNIKWKVEIPGRGAASPVVWGDRVYVLTAVPIGLGREEAHAARGGIEPRHVYRFMTMALDRGNGHVVWERVSAEERPHESTHVVNGTWASSSAATDGEVVIAHFESHGMYAYDMNGKLLWEQRFGEKAILSESGEGTTPALYGNYVVLVWDQSQGGSFIVVLDKRTGKEVWRASRDEADTWPTPLVVEHDGRVQVITSGWGSIQAYDLETGRVIWHTSGLTPLPIPSPVAEDGIVVAMSGGNNGSRLKAIRLAEAKGDITGTSAIAWTLDRDTPYAGSPLLFDGLLYFVKSNSGLLSVFDAKTGTPHYRLQRLVNVPNVYASPVGADGRVYIAGADGTTVVIRHGPTFEVLASNTLDDGFTASPALVDNDIYLRGNKHLYCIADQGANGRRPQ